MHEPLRVRAYLQTGVVSDAYLPLDGVIYHLVHREQLGPEVMTLPGASVASGDSEARMPFARARKNRRHWSYRCSFAVWPEHVVEGSEAWAKRLDVGRAAELVDFGERRGNVAVGSGAYKGYYMPVFYRHALHVDWYCVADRARLEQLLRFATHLGKKTSQGWGAVRGWEIEPWHADWSERDDDGRLMRAVYDSQSTTRYGIRPSYWRPENQFPVRLP